MKAMVRTLCRTAGALAAALMIFGALLVAMQAGYEMAIEDQHFRCDVEDPR